MELWNQIEIFNKKKQNWLFKSDNIEERLDALSKILEFGYPSSIQYLIPHLKDENSEIQKETCKAIIQLFRKINTKKGYYDSLKHCDISKTDIDYYQHFFQKEDSLILLSIASLNGNGYVREKAVKKLAETKDVRAIPFIVYRLADWVYAVGQTAKNGLESFKKKEFINALVDNLSIFEWLQKVQRVDLTSIYKDIMEFVVIDNKDYVIEHLYTFTDKTRILIGRQLADKETATLDDLRILLNDNHFIVRSMVLSHFEKLTQIEIDKLLKDKSSKIRIKTLYKIKENPNFSEIIFTFLADNSASVREFARYALKNEIGNFSEIYNNNLIKKTCVYGSICGLSETDGKQFIENIEVFLDDKSIKIRKASFKALIKLDTEKAYIFALKNLDSDQAGIRNIAIDFLSHPVTNEVLQKAREVYSKGRADLKKSMLVFFSKVGKWTTIGDIIIGTIENDEDIRRLSFDFLQQWKNLASRYFTEPKQGELERANQLFKFAFEMHEEKKFFKENPLVGLDFYLR